MGSADGVAADAYAAPRVPEAAVHRRVRRAAAGQHGSAFCDWFWIKVSVYISCVF